MQKVHIKQIYEVYLFDDCKLINDNDEVQYLIWSYREFFRKRQIRLKLSQKDFLFIKEILKPFEKEEDIIFVKEYYSITRCIIRNQYKRNRRRYKRIENYLLTK